MKFGMRIAAVLLIALMLALSLASCGEDEPQKAPVIGYAAGYEVRYDELRFVTVTQKMALESKYGKGIWSTPESAEQYRSELEAAVWDNMLSNYAVLAACQQFGLSTSMLESEQIQTAVDASINSAINECGGRSAFEARLEATYMTEDFLRFSLAVTQMENELRYKLSGELGLIESDSDRFMNWMADGNAVYVQHVFIENDANEDVEENRALALDVRGQLLRGEKTIGQVIGSAINEDLSNFTPYYVVRDVYALEIETAVLVLDKVGAVSDVVQTDKGFYIFVRMQESFDDHGINQTMLSKVDSLLTSYQWARVESFVQAAKEGLTIELNDYGKSLDLLAIQ